MPAASPADSSPPDRPASDRPASDRPAPGGTAWTRLLPVLDAALDLAPDARPAYLDTACAGDPALRAEVEALLALDTATDGRLRASMATLAAPLLAARRVTTGPGAEGTVGATATRWRRLQRLFHDLVVRPPDEQAAALAALDDDALRDDLAAMLDADANASVLGDGVLGDGVLGDGVLDNLAATRAEPPGADAVGEMLGPYRLLSLQGQGGMGAVYRAVRDDVGKEVALKVIGTPFLTPGLRRRFAREQRLLARLQHPHIAHLVDAGTTDLGWPYFAMEFVEGAPLTTHCDRLRLDVRARLRLFADVCDAVAHAQQNLVVHRDLKPSNILVTDDGRVKLLDFGIAKLLDAAYDDAGSADPEDAATHLAALTRTGDTLMTPAYAAPEQVTGEAVTTATDVYALGAILYELLTGRRPYALPDTRPATVARVVCEVTPPRPSNVVTTAYPAPHAERPEVALPPETLSAARAATPAALRRQLRGDLDRIVAKALRKEPARRYATAAALGADVKRFLRREPVQARPATLGYRLRRFAQRNRTGVVAAALVLLALLGGLGTTQWQARRAAQERDRAQAAAAKAEAVAGFLRSLFQEADPDRTRGDTLNAYQILHRGRRRLATDLADQPALRGVLLTEIGEIYATLGAYPAADSALADALAALPPDAPDRAATLYARGRFAQKDGRFEEAARLLRRALDLYVAGGLDAQPVELHRTRYRLGAVLAQLGRFDEAAPPLEAALDGFRADAPDDDDLVAVLGTLGQLHARQGDWAAALPWFRDAKAAAERLLPPTHSARLLTLNGLAVVLKRTGALGEAEAMFRETLALQRRVLGPKHPNVGLTLNNLGALRKDQGALDEAAAHFEDALAVWAARLDPGHPYRAVGLTNLAEVEHQRGRLAEAERLYREALTLRRASLPEGHPQLASTLAGLAHLRLDQRDAAEAEALAREAVAIRTAQADEDGRRYAEGLLGAALVVQGRPAAARPLLAGGLALADSLYGPDHRYTRLLQEATAEASSSEP